MKNKYYIPLLILFFLRFSGVSYSQVDSTQITMNAYTPKNTGNSSSANISIWPNPAVSSIKISLNTLRQGDKGECVIYNSNGQPCLSNIIRNGTNQALLTGLPSGIYFAKIMLQNIVVVSRKLIVSKKQI